MRIPEATLNRAKAGLGAKSHRDDRAEWWYDPAAAWPKTAPFRKPLPGELPPLTDLF